MGRITAVIFDLDGTLLDRNKSLRQFIVDQYHRIIKKVTDIDQTQYVHRFVELDNHGYVWKDRVYLELIQEFDFPLDVNDLLTDYIHGFSKFATPFPNAYETLEQFKNRGYKLGLITNGYGEFQSRNLHALAIQNYFDVILISENEGIRKPDSAIFHRTAERLGVSLKECVYVGDHPVNDVAASRKAGMRGIWKEDSFYGECVECDGVVSDLLDVYRIVEKWNGIQ